MILHFATLFDVNYLSRGLCLIDSLKKTLAENFILYVLALDEDTKEYFQKNESKQIIVIGVSDLENADSDLLIAKGNRSKVEYYFTLSPVLPLYILQNFSDCKRITTLDADIYFYSDPSLIFNIYHEEDILITPHDFSSNIKYLEEFGKYNVSYQSFPNTINAINLLNDWKQKCLAWCSDLLDLSTGYFADQKYLDDWQSNFDHVKDINLKTTGRAPWNIKETPLKLKKGKLFVNDDSLIYYHFHHLRIYDNFISHGINLYGLGEVNEAVGTLYRIYLLNLKENNKLIHAKTDDQIIRYQSTLLSKRLLSNIWEKERGAIYTLNTVIFFNITYIKRLYKYFLRKKDGLFN